MNLKLTKLMFNLLFLLFLFFSFHFHTSNAQETATLAINSLTKKERHKVLQCKETELPYRIRTPNGKLEFACASHELFPVYVKMIGDSLQLCFNNESFKIVIGTSNETFCVSNWKNLDLATLTKVVRASNILFYLKRAREYFLSHPVFGADYQDFESQGVSKLTVVRIDQPLSWANGLPTKYTKQPLINNIVTIPPSNKGVAAEFAWGKEIWFGLPTVVKIKSDLEVVGDILDQRNIKQIIATPFVVNYLVESSSNFVRSLTDPIYKAYFYHPFTPIFSLLIMQGVVELIPKLIKLGGKTHKKDILLDGAMIPEIIYNEFSHIVLTHYYAVRSINNFNSLLLNESVANYFSTKISKNEVMVKHFAHAYVGLADRKREKKIPYYRADFEFEQEVIFSSYGLSFFYKFDEIFGPTLADVIIAKTFQSFLVAEGLVKSLETNDLNKKLTIPYFIKKASVVVTDQFSCEIFLAAAKQDQKDHKNQTDGNPNWGIWGILDLEKIDCHDSSSTFLKILYQKISAIAASTGS